MASSRPCSRCRTDSSKRSGEPASELPSHEQATRTRACCSRALSRSCANQRAAGSSDSGSARHNLLGAAGSRESTGAGAGNQGQAMSHARHLRRRASAREVRRYWSPVTGREYVATRVATHGRRARAEAHAAIVVGSLTGCEHCGAPVQRDMIIRGQVGCVRTTYQLCPVHLRELLTPMAAGGES